ADLPAGHPAARGQFLRHQRGLDRIGVVQRGLWVLQGDQAALDAALFGPEKRLCASGNGLWHHSSRTPFRRAPMPSAETSITSPGTNHFGGSKRAPAPVGVPVTMMSPGT